MKFKTKIINLFAVAVFAIASLALYAALYLCPLPEHWDKVGIEVDRKTYAGVLKICQGITADHYLVEKLGKKRDSVEVISMNEKKCYKGCSTTAVRFNIPFSSEYVMHYECTRIPEGAGPYINMLYDENDALIRMVNYPEIPVN